jgi:G3E family GTPase
VRTDLQETLRDLFARRRSGELPDFDRVIVETTGLADPAPVVQTLSSDTLLAAQFRLDGLVTLVDAFNGAQQIEQQTEAIKQIALADRIFITKSDLVTPANVESLKAAIHAINPNAAQSQIVQGEVDPKLLTGLGLASARASQATLSFLGESLEKTGDTPARYLGDKTLNHDPRIKTVSLRFDKAFTWASFSAAMELLTTLRGPDMLRVKGIVNVEGQPVVVQGVQHIFHPPVTLDRWPSADTGTRLVFITRNIEAATIRNLLTAVSDMST